MGLLYCNLLTTANLFFSFFHRLVIILGGLTRKKEEVSILYVCTFLYLHCSFYCRTVFLYTCLLSTAVDAQLDDVGLGFVKNSISAIEKRGKFTYEFTYKCTYQFTRIKTYHYLTYITRKHFFEFNMRAV